MNSDPYDSAAWRTFGMLDADESAIFDEAMRHDPVLRSAYLEMDRLSAAIAAATSSPIEPKAGQIERLHSRLGVSPSRRTYLWIGLSGWAAAAVLAVLLVLDHTGNLARPAASPVVDADPTTAQPASPPIRREASPAASPTDTKPGEDSSDGVLVKNHELLKEQEVKASVKVETKRLVQEIEVLRDNLEKFQHRDRVLFEAVPGMALPIVMRMTPPGLDQESSAAFARSNDDSAPLTAMLGDALKVMTATNLGTQEVAVVTPASPAGDIIHPTAIPIYDAARDSGTLVISNLPAAEAGKVYNLWVNTATGEKPIYVGSLPASSASGADSFDFSLGSNMVLPSGFVLTKDPLNAPTNPTNTNTVLQGPPTPSR